MIKEVKTIVLQFENHCLIQVKELIELKHTLSLCFAGDSLLIFFVNTEQDMIFLESLKTQHMDIKLLIYIAIDDSTLVSRGYALFPRLVIDVNSHKNLLPAAVEKFLQYKDTIKI